MAAWDDAITDGSPTTQVQNLMDALDASLGSAVAAMAPQAIERYLAGIEASRREAVAFSRDRLDVLAGKLSELTSAYAKEQAIMAQAMRNANAATLSAQTDQEAMAARLKEIEAENAALAERLEAALARAAEALRDRDVALLAGEEFKKRLASCQEQVVAWQAREAEALARVEELLQEKIDLKRRVDRIQENWERIGNLA